MQITASCQPPKSALRWELYPSQSKTASAKVKTAYAGVLCRLHRTELTQRHKRGSRVILLASAETDTTFEGVVCFALSLTFQQPQFRCKGKVEYEKLISRLRRDVDYSMGIPNVPAISNAKHVSLENRDAISFHLACGLILI